MMEFSALWTILLEQGKVHPDMYKTCKAFFEAGEFNREHEVEQLAKSRDYQKKHRQKLLGQAMDDFTLLNDAHQLADTLFAQLITLSGKQGGGPFSPSKHPLWPVMVKLAERIHKTKDQDGDKIQ